MRGFGWNLPRFEHEEVSLRDRVREWEQDEQRKMEQERLARQGRRRNLDHLKRGDQNATETATDQAADEDHSWSSDQNRLNEERCVRRLREDVEETHRLILDNQGEEMLGEATYDRASNASRSPLEIDHQ
jgi:hypothetical protein